MHGLEKVWHTCRMLYEAQHDSPADPLLGDALRQSLVLMRAESEYIHRLMSAAHKAYPHLIGGEPVAAPDGDIHEYISPEAIRNNESIIDAAGKQVADDLDAATTLDEQKRIYLGSMREMLDTSLLMGAGARTGFSAIRTLELAFDEYPKDAKRSRALLDLQQDVKYYARICYDAIACNHGLMKSVEDNNLPGNDHYASSPYDLAHLRADRRPHTLDKNNGSSARLALHEDALNVLNDILEPYHDALPDTVSADMLGLIWRCSEQVANRVYAEKSKEYGYRSLGNDNGPKGDAALLADPLVRRRVNTILTAVFLKHPDASLSAEAMAEASMSLEEELVRDEKLFERGGRTR